jgi:hypothetical protein
VWLLVDTTRGCLEAHPNESFVLLEAATAKHGMNNCLVTAIAEPSRR